MTPVSRSSGEGCRSQRNKTLSPAFRALPPPVIVIGMHRSGTSLVSGMLSLMGAYMDPGMASIASDEGANPPGDALRRFGYGEAAAFRQVNDSLLHCAGADWRRPEPFLEHRDRPGFQRIGRFLTQHAALTSLRRDYLAHAPAEMTAWGWKDPRNSLTLPCWLELFPDARVLHVRRSPQAVVDSLVKRDEAGSGETSMGAPPVSARLRRALTDPAYALGALRRRIGRLPAAVDAQPFGRARYYRLAEMYVAESMRATSLCGNYLEIGYEELLMRPYAIAARMASFARMSPGGAQIERAVAFIERPPCASGLFISVSGIRRSSGYAGRRCERDPRDTSGCGKRTR